MELLLQKLDLKLLLDEFISLIPDKNKISIEFLSKDQNTILVLDPSKEKIVSLLNQISILNLTSESLFLENNDCDIQFLSFSIKVNSHSIKWKFPFKKEIKTVESYYRINLNFVSERLKTFSISNLYPK